MTSGDRIVEKGAERLQALADKAAAGNGLRARLAKPLADDAAFMRKLKPSLIAARVRGELPTNQEPQAGSVAPSGPQIGKRPKGKGRGVNPYVAIGAAFAVGILLAKVVDWRGHAHPSD